MKQIYPALIIIFCVGAFVWIDIHIATQQHTQRLQEINNLRDDIVRSDSVRKAQQKQVLDNIRKTMVPDFESKQQLKSINSKLRQLNEKTDNLYSALHVDMPDL